MRAMKGVIGTYEQLRPDKRDPVDLASWRLAEKEVEMLDDLPGAAQRTARVGETAQRKPVRVGGGGGMTHMPISISETDVRMTPRNTDWRVQGSTGFVSPLGVCG